MDCRNPRIGNCSTARIAECLRGTAEVSEQFERDVGRSILILAAYSTP